MTLVSRNLLVVTSTRSIHNHCKQDPSVVDVRSHDAI